ncbi:hypothetical protein ACFL37_00350 [Candidatus Margulisiibacteriota bacterium]
MISATANAQEPQPLWSSQGVVVNDTSGNTPQQNPGLVSDGAGNYLIAWEDGRAGYYDVYMQKIDRSGKALWKNNGIAVSRSYGNQNFPKVAADGSGGAIIVWQDYRNGNSDIYAQRVGPGGALLWSEQGVPICLAEAGQFAPELIPDGAGGALLTWHDYRSGSGEDIYVQRIDANGQPLWQADGIEISTASGTQWYPKLSADGSGGAIIVWTDGRAGSVNNNIYAQRIDLSGKTYWEKDGIPVCAAPDNQESPTITAVSEGVVIAWNDSRSGNIDIYAQKLGVNGSPHWKKDGVAICIFPYSQEDPQVAADGSGGAVMVWTDHRAEMSDIYAQRIYSDGRIAWSENGRPVSQSLGTQKKPIITKLKNEDWVILWENEEDVKLKVDLYAQKINSAGTPVWQTNGVPLAAVRGEQESAAAVAAPDGSIVAVWEDRRFGNYDIYSQKLSPDGLILWERSGVLVCAASGSVVQQNIALVPNGKGEIILVFEDARSGYFNTYAQKIGKSGQLAWGKDGVAIAKVAANQANPCLVADQKGGAIVAWEDHRIESRPAIRVQRLSRKGKNVWESSLPVSLAKSRQTRPLLISDNAGGAIIAWQDDRNVLSLEDIYVQRISPQGKLLWGNNGKIFVSENGNQLDTAMIPDGAGGAILTWTDFRRGDRNPDIYTQKIDAKGKLLWKQGGVLVCGAPDVQRAPKIISDGDGGAIISWTDRGGGSYDIYAQRVNKTGKTLWMTDGIPINQLSRTQQNSRFGNQQTLVWEDYRYGNWDIFAGAVDLSGKLVWGEEGVPVALIPQTQYAPETVPWDNGSIIIAWEDYRSGQHYDIYMQKLDGNGRPVWAANGIKIQSEDGGRVPKILATTSDNSFYVFWENYTGGGRAIYGQRYLLY